MYNYSDMLKNLEITSEYEKTLTHEMSGVEIHMRVSNAQCLAAFLASVLDIEIDGQFELLVGGIKLVLHEELEGCTVQIPSEMHFTGYTIEELKNILSRAEFFYFRESGQWPANFNFKLPVIDCEKSHLCWLDWHGCSWIFRS